MAIKDQGNQGCQGTLCSSAVDLDDFLSCFIYHFKDTSPENDAPRVGYAAVGTEVVPYSRHVMRSPNVATAPELFCAHIPPQYFCSLCSRLMLDATLLNPCGHYFCGTCVETEVLSRRRAKCPHCRRHCQKRRSLPAGDVREALWKMRVYCPFSMIYDVCSGRFVPASLSESSETWSSQISGTSVSQSSGTSVSQSGGIAMSQSSGTSVDDQQHRDDQQLGHQEQQEQEDHVAQEEQQEEHVEQEEQEEDHVEQEEQEQRDQEVTREARRKRFCSLTMVLANLENHVRRCGYRPVYCPYEQDGCAQIILDGDLGLHRRFCRFNYSYPVCDTCHCAIGADDTMAEHLANDCLLPCPYVKYGCEDRMLHDDVDDHLDTCPFAGTDVPDNAEISAGDPPILPSRDGAEPGPDRCSPAVHQDPTPAQAQAKPRKLTSEPRPTWYRRARDRVWIPGPRSCFACRVKDATA
ncbi:hypothetical protein CBR_g32266 [Chara braunii]|uniref:RING-type domain-containing protein n=1 Tax=Chara braunii TaxID=69332 RepID=A0A388JN43_CHABU|nr:hypothetical protein CBR_g32266 [Chara braunii]|eukprot:GBG59250.1 hypothetical protein CBR_g32266 [Chara braunii]